MNRIAGALVLAMGVTAAADEPPVFIGSRVRLVTDRGAMVGNVLAWEEGRVSVLTGGDQTQVVPASSIRRVELSRGRKRPILKNALVGAGVGAAIYGLMPLESPCPPGVQPSLNGCETHGSWAAMGAWAGAVVGTVVGAVRRVDRWENVPAARFRIGIAPVSGGAAAAVTITH